MKMVDRREVEFDAQAVVRAISASTKAAQGFGLPGMAPVDVRFQPQIGSADVVYRTSSGSQAVSISAEALGAILISYCIRVRIPMPRKSSKGIRIESGSVILAFTTTYSDVQMPVAAESASRPAEPVAAWKWLQPEGAVAVK